MKKRLALGIILMLGLACYAGTLQAGQKLPVSSHPATDAYPGWKLATQCWSFHKYTFYEAVDKTAALGVDWIEAFPGQKLGGPHPDSAKFGPGMSKKLQKAVKQKLDDADVRLINFGVVGLPNNEKKCRQVFEFAEEMGIQTIVSEPPMEAMKMIDGLCQEYGIKVAIHNHPKPSTYWNPDTVLKAVKGCSKMVGACADTGHWVRSGIDPLKALKKLEGRIVSLHFKDIKDGHDVPWGTGEGKARALLEELDRQGFEGVFSIEYEHNWLHSMPSIRKCARFFGEVSRDLHGDGWKPVFGPELSNAIMQEGAWKWKDGVLAPTGHGDIWTKAKYGDFVFDLEFKLADGTNSGVFLRCGSLSNWLHTAIEVQVLDSYGRKNPGRHDCGAIYDCLAPKSNTVKKPGEWNHYTITCKDNMIYVVLNDTQIIKMDLNRWEKPHRNPDGTKNKFNNAYKNMPRKGHLGLQYHGQPIYYRNLKVKEL